MVTLSLNTLLRMLNLMEEPEEVYHEQNNID